ncbi:MAG: energy transducer TonB [Sphingomonadales bacterium]|nr:energy transducer TonB [Sphingomonadales bacterium]MBK7283995.1 energy transducer TonB [Sphingomonadales bacterium]
MSLVVAMLTLFGAAAMIGTPVPNVAKHAVVIGGSISDELYPEDARKAKTEGTAIVTFIVDEKGKPQNCNTLRTSGSDLLDAATCKAAAGFRFKAAKDKNGRTVNEAFLFGIAWTMPKNLNVFGPKPETNN